MRAGGVVGVFVWGPAQRGEERRGAVREEQACAQEHGPVEHIHQLYHLSQRSKVKAHRLVPPPGYLCTNHGLRILLPVGL